MREVTNSNNTSIGVTTFPHSSAGLLLVLAGLDMYEFETRSTPTTNSQSASVRSRPESFETQGVPAFFMSATIRRNKL